MIIERLSYNELEEYKDLINECFEAEDTLERYQNNYNENDDNLVILVAKENNKIIGSITYLKVNLFTFSMQPSMMLFNVCTKDEYRGKGVAKKIFNYIYDIALKEGYKQITLTCLESELGVHKFYETKTKDKSNNKSIITKQQYEQQETHHRRAA